MELEQKIVEYLQKTESLIVEEAPAFIQEAVNFYFYKELFFTIEAFLFFVLFIVLMFYCWTKRFKNTIEEMDRSAPVDFLSNLTSFCCAAFSIIPFSIFVTNCLSLIQVCVAPKLYLVEKFMT